MSDITRPMGLSERYSLSRSLTSSQPAPIVLVNLVSPSHLPSDALLPRVQAALAAILPLHPTLFVRFTKIHSSSPGLAFLPSVDVKKVISVEQDRGKIDVMLERVMERELSLEGKEGEGKEEEEAESEVPPPWRVLLWVPEDVKEGVWIGFVGHHALFDGAAVMTFTTALVGALSTTIASSTPPSTTSPLVVPLPPSPTFPPTLESIHPVSVSLRTLLPLIFTELLLPKLPAFLRPSPPPSAWVGRSSTSSSPLPAHPRRKRHLTFHLPSTTTKPLIQICRKNQTSLTSLLHTLLARSIRTNLLPLDSDAKLDLKSVTPLSLRPSHLRELAGGTYVGIFPQTISSSSPPPTGENDDETQTWLPSRLHHSLLRQPSVIPSALEQWGLLAYVPSGSSSDPTLDGWAPFFLPKTSLSEWQLSFELSNLGRVDFNLGTELRGEGWEIGGVVFTQGAQARGPPLVVSVVGWEGGLSLGFSWEEGVLEGGKGDVERVWEGVRAEVEKLVEVGRVEGV